MSVPASRRSVRARGSRFALSASVAAALLMSVIALEGQRRGANNAAAGVPIGTATLLADPGKYYGRVVTMSAGIEQVLSKTAFVIDQRRMVTPTEVRAAGTPVLIIAPELIGEPDPKHYVMVKGQVVRFTAAEIEKAVPGYRLDLPQEASDRFAGQPVLIASSVINSVYKEIGRRPPRPEELELSTAMKVISPALAALRTAAQQSTSDAIASNVAALVPAFTQVEAVWERLGAAPAAEWSREARRHANELQGAAAAGNWEAAKSAFGALNQTCASCHLTYREALDDGTYRIKRGTI